ncbi:MAG: TnpV protein [Oscillospiraceae bacterium]|nr:TnpV protein [Oscillospiraceae bacterium]
MGGTYTQVGDYLLPDLVIAKTDQHPIGKYGRLRKRYLKEHRPVLYSNLLTAGNLYRHMSEIDQACEERMDLLTHQMAKQEGVNEALKATDQLEWVRRMNSIRNRAEEIILHELVFG